ncbi:MAG: phosphoglycerate mutase [Candidatus Methanomethylophilaceae archaeon]|nr:phosphoglycerate mutase [Candidatus Methanomethylophilaceae archaeon]
MENTLFVLLDGAEDHPHPDLDGRKPLDVAEMPFLERKAPHRIRTTGRGYTHLFLNEFLTGHPPEIPRGALEALGLGMSMQDPRRTAYRLSPAEIRDGMIEWSYHSGTFCDRLMEVMDANMGILEPYNPEIRYFIGGRAVLTMECDDVPDLPAPPVNAPFVEVPGILGEFVMKVAEDMGGITDYPWGCGKFGHQYDPVPGINNLTAISDSPTSLGICASLGYDIMLVDDLDDRFPLARDALEHGDVFLHVDEVDEYSHQKDPMKKKWVLEHADELMEEYFSDVDNIIYFVDHGTSCVTGEHILMDVPLWTSMDAGFGRDEMVPLDTVLSTLLRYKR